MKAFIGTNIIDVKTESILQDQVIIVDGPSIAQIIPSAESSNLNLDSMEEIYDVSGLKVRTLKVGHRQVGFYIRRTNAIYWDGRNDLGEDMTSGIYYYRFISVGYDNLRKMIILR